METTRYRKSMAVIGNEATVAEFVFNGVGPSVKSGRPNFFVVDAETNAAETAEMFRSFVGREDVAIVLIDRKAAESIRATIDQHSAGIPFVIERPADRPPTFEDPELFRQALDLLDRFQLPIYDLLCSLVLNCPPTHQREYINLLAAFLKRVGPQSFNVSALAVWTALISFVSPTRLNISSSSNEEVFDAFEHHLKPMGQTERQETGAALKSNQWENRQLYASVLFFYSISVQCTVGTFSRRGKLNLSDPLGEAIDMRALHFIAWSMRQIDNFSTYSVTVELIDCFIKYFIIHCHSKLHEMFCVCEEELADLELVQQQASAHSSFHASVEQRKDYSMNFKIFLYVIQTLYDGDNEQLVQLSRQYFMPDYDHLGQFLRSATSITSPTLYVDYVLMLAALCKTNIAANFLFRHFNNSRDPLYDWASLFGSLRQYAQVFRRRQAAHPNHPHSQIAIPQKMRKQEKMGTIAWIRLAATISKFDADARRYFVIGNHFNAVEILVSAVTSSMPRRLKGEVYKLLGVLAQDENSASLLWNMLIREHVCELGDDGKLSGIVPVEFDEKECSKHNYAATFGFLQMVRSLFSRRHLPDSRVLAAYVHFVNKSIICQYNQRSYEYEQQVWELLSVGVDSFFQFLRRFHISPATVSRRGPHVFLLWHLLSESDLNQAVIRALIECCKNLDCVLSILEHEDETADFAIAEARVNASKILLRLVAHVATVHPSLRASLRSSTEATAIFVPALETLMLTPLPSAPQSNYVQLLYMYIDDRDVLLAHTYYVIRILRKLAAKPSGELHDALLRTFELNARSMQCIFGRLLSIHAHTIEVSDQDVVPFDLHDVSLPRLRGEIAREVLELFDEIMDAAPQRPNLCFLLFGYDLSSYRIDKQISFDGNTQVMTCMHSMVDLIESLMHQKEPHTTPWAVLYEPALRLLSKLCAVGSLSSEPTLRYLRNSSNLIYNLTQSPLFQDAHADAAINGERNETNGLLQPSERNESAGAEVDQPERVPVHLETFRRQIRGLILDLVAVDFSVAMSSNHVRLPSDYISVLLSIHEQSAAGDSTAGRSAKTSSRAILWSLLYNSLSASLDVETPTYENFDMTRVDEVLKLCLRRDSSGVEVYDVERVHFVLNEELSSILNTDVTDLRKEANKILLYCVQYNAQMRLEGSCLQVLSGWVAFVNAIVFFAPLPFLDLVVQEAFLNDALVVLKEYVETVNMNEEVLGGVSNCIFRITRRLVQFACLKWDSEHERKVALGTLMHIVVRCLTLPGYNRYTRFKMDMYGAMLCIIEACTQPTVDSDRECIARFKQTGGIIRARNPDEQLAEASLKPASLIDATINAAANAQTLEGLLNRRADVERHWTALFRENAAELVQSCALDVEYAPLGHKLLAIACLSEMVREDRDRQQSAILQQITRLGLLKGLLDALPGIVDANFADAQHDRPAAFQMLQTCLALFVRVASSRGGFALLADVQVLPRLAKLRCWKEAPENVVAMFELLQAVMQH